MKAPFQQFVTQAASLLAKAPDVKVPALNADYAALVWIAGSVSGIDYRGMSPDTFAATAVDLVRQQVALGVFPPSHQLYGAVNHPFHSGDHIIEIIARAHDWLWHYPGYTQADKAATAAYLLETSRIFFEEPHPNTNRPAMRWSGPGDAFAGSPGSEAHFPWYYVLPLIGDGLVDDTKARQILATFDAYWLQGAWLDVAHYESRGAGTKALGGYGEWYPERLILNFHAWSTATGQNYFETPTSMSPDPGYFRNYPLTYGVLRKPQDPSYYFPLGQSSGDARMPSHIMRMLTGVISGVPAQYAAWLGGPIAGSNPRSLFGELLTYNPSISPVAIPDGITLYRTYGLLVDRRSDGTVLTMGAPPIHLKGHTWATQGGGPKNGIPLGVTLQVANVPILVKHVGAHRGAMPSFGQNAVRFYDPLVPTTDLAHWIAGGSGGFQTKATAATHVQEITAADDKGGIKGYTGDASRRAVADLTRWYLPSLVSNYTRTYEWGSNWLKVIDEVTTARPDILVWSRWYTGHRPVADGASVPDGISTRAKPSIVGLGPVQWQIIDAPAAELHVAGGPGFEWVDDLGAVYSNSADVQVMNNVGPLEVGAYTITLKSAGSSRWEHLFTW